MVDGRRRWARSSGDRAENRLPVLQTLAARNGPVADVEVYAPTTGASIGLLLRRESHLVTPFCIELEATAHLPDVHDAELSEDHAFLQRQFFELRPVPRAFPYEVRQIGEQGRDAFAHEHVDIGGIRFEFLVRLH
jgi:hypothetical protein